MTQKPPPGTPAASIENIRHFPLEDRNHGAGKQLMSLLDTLDEAITTIDTQWHYTYVNPLAAALLGQPCEALLGQLVWDLLPETVVELFAAEAHHAVQNNTMRQFEAWYPALNRWFVSRIYPSPEGILVRSQDMTEHKQHELDAACLAEAERQRLHDLFMQAPALIVVLRGPNHVVELVNPLYMQAVGIHRDIIGRPIREALSEITEQGFHTLLDQVYQTGKPFTGKEIRVYVARKGDGTLEEAYYTFVYQPSYNAAGDIDGVIAFGFEVTEQVAARKRAKESEARFRTLADNISQLAWMSDETGWLFWYNQRWYNYTGTNLQDMQGWGWQKVHHPDHVQRVTEKFRHYLATGEIWEDTFPLRSKDGEYRWFLSRAIPIKDETGKVLRWFGTNTDVTEQIQTEEALRQLTVQQEATLAQLDSLLKNAPVGFSFFDQDHRYLRINDFLAEINGIPAQEHIGKKFETLLPEKAEFISPIIERVLKTQKPVINQEVVGQTPREPGVTRYWLTSFYPVMNESNKEVESVGSVVMEITDRKRLEQQKDEFIGVASHELKTPVTSLKAYTQLLERRFRQSGDTRSAVLFQKMDVQLNKLASLIEELLDVTKIENGQLQLQYSSFDANTFIHEVIEETQRVTNRHHIVQELAPSVTLQADRDRIGQVLTNLLTNAIKYSPQADTVLVKTVRIEDALIISVHDFGIGIAKEKQEHLFERFFRVEGENQLTYPGLGLGLYISAEFVKRHHGSIWVESEAGAGTTVSFSLPLPQQPTENNS